MNCNKNSILPFFLAGLGSGIALTLLFAPRSGFATRSILGRKAEEAESWVKAKAALAEDFALANAKDLRDRVKTKAEIVA